MVASRPCPQLAVRLRLFGFACDWAPAAAEAVTAALRNATLRNAAAPPAPGTVAVQTRREALAAHRPGPPAGELRIQARSLDTEEGLAVAAAAKVVALDFLTPASLRGSADPREGLAGFIGALLNRVIGMARWLDAGIEVDRPALLAAADRVHVDAGDLAPVNWRRGSAKQDRVLPMDGLTGTVHLEGDLAPLMPLLALGALVHVGARTTFGQGRYRLRVIV